MLVAISQRNDKNKHGDLIDNLENNYVNYLEGFGINLVIIPNTSDDIDFYFKGLPIEGVILTGGNAVNPKLYGEKLPKDPDVSKQRDSTEEKLLDIAIKKRLPVFSPILANR